MIPDEAVEAAAKGFATSLAGTSITYRAFLKDARAALEAAAPVLMAQAWLEGRNAQPDKFASNPYWKPADE